MPQAPLTVAVLTDVHGNGFAAEAVAEDIARFQPDAIINLGDQLWGQANPVLALEVQKSLGAYEVRGNNDERLAMAANDLRIAGHGQILQGWLRERVTETDLQRIAHLPLHQELFDDELIAMHGTFNNPWGSLLWGWNKSGENFWALPDEQVESQFPQNLKAQVVVIGHSHLPQVRHLNGRLLVNVGPVALQNDGDPRAQWTLLRRQQGQWTAEMRRVKYDWQKAAQWILRSAPDKGEAHKMTNPRTVSLTTFLNPQ